MNCCEVDFQTLLWERGRACYRKDIVRAAQDFLAPAGHPGREVYRNLSQILLDHMLKINFEERSSVEECLTVGKTVFKYVEQEIYRERECPPDETISSEVTKGLDEEEEDDVRAMTFKSEISHHPSTNKLTTKFVEPPDIGNRGSAELNWVEDLLKKEVEEAGVSSVSVFVPSNDRLDVDSGQPEVSSQALDTGASFAEEMHQDLEASSSKITNRINNKPEDLKIEMKRPSDLEGPKSSSSTSDEHKRQKTQSSKTATIRPAEATPQ